MAREGELGAPPVAATVTSVTAVEAEPTDAPVASEGPASEVGGVEPELASSSVEESADPADADLAAAAASVAEVLEPTQDLTEAQDSNEEGDAR